jgi:hypothetical protein
MNVVLENNLWLILTVWGTTSSSGRHQIPSLYKLLNSEPNPERSIATEAQSRRWNWVSSFQILNTKFPIYPSIPYLCPPFKFL